MKRLVLPGAFGGSALVRDYLQQQEPALRFYAGSPFRLASYRAKLDEVSQRFPRDKRETAARALRPTSETAARRLEQFVEQGGAMVTTGQQAGFLTGPLYTLHKALSAVHLARHLEASLGILVLPVFWIASDDHDWAEVDHAVLLDSRNRAQTFTLSSTEGRPLPISQRLLEGDLEELCDHIFEVVAPTRHNEEKVRKILDAYRQPGRTMAAAFADAIAELLAPYDVCIADAADPVLKEASVPVISRALREAESQEESLQARTSEIEDAGYSVQVAVLEGGTNVFRHSEAGRDRLYRRGEGFAVRERRSYFKLEELLDELEREPTSFSPNVFLRPVVESAVFPTLAYVGGPGELAYFAQATALFTANEIAPPQVVPRFTGVVMEPKIEKLLASLELDLTDINAPRDSLIERLARQEMPPAVTELLTSIRDDLVRDFDQLLDEVKTLDETLAGAMGTIRNRTLLSTVRAERKVIRAIKRGDRVAVEKLDRVLDSLRPHGAPQDRVLNVLPFLGRFGDHFLREVDRAIEGHWRLPTGE